MNTNSKKRYDPEKRKKRYESNKAKIALQDKKRYENNKEKYRESCWRQLGIEGFTYENYLELLEKQNYSCAICGKHQDNCSRQLSADHCHSTGKVRGLLCFDCNSAIGRLGDNYEGVMRAANYLLEFEEGNYGI